MEEQEKQTVCPTRLLKCLNLYYQKESPGPYPVFSAFTWLWEMIWDRIRLQTKPSGVVNKTVMNDQLHKGVVSIKIKGYKPFQGIFIENAEQWTLIKYIPNDYLVGGIAFVNNYYIKELNKSDDDIFKEKVLKLKCTAFVEEHNFNLQNYTQLLSDLMLKNSLIQVCLDDEEISYVGIITKVHEKSFRLRMLSTKAVWLKEYSFNHKSIRMIHLNNDYLESLSLIVDSPQLEQTYT